MRIEAQTNELHIVLEDVIDMLVFGSYITGDITELSKIKQRRVENREKYLEWVQKHDFPHPFEQKEISSILTELFKEIIDKKKKFKTSFYYSN